MSNDEKGLLKKILKGYNDSKLGIINKLADIEGSSFDENGFLDDGYIGVKIEHLKREYKKIEEEINFLGKYDKKEDEYKKQKLISLIERQRNIQIDLAFYASNSFVNIESCLNLVNNIDTDLILCLEGLLLYKKNDIPGAFNKFSKFYSGKDYLLDHYLINKTFGILLYKANHKDEALQFLRKAVEKRPEDLETHELIKEIYRHKNNSVGEKIEAEIISLLGGLK